MSLQLETIPREDPRYPAHLRERLGRNAPPQVTALGNLTLLAPPKTALFCSARCPGSAILRAYDQAAQWRDEGRCIISGFHAPVEKECLRILLRGTQPIILCPARALPKRIPLDWQTALDAGRLLLLSAFPETETRITTVIARRRNEFVAALADEAIIIHATPGGHVAQLSEQFQQWSVRVIRVVGG